RQSTGFFADLSTVHTLSKTFSTPCGYVWSKPGSPFAALGKVVHKAYPLLTNFDKIISRVNRLLFISCPQPVDS
ncbi:hypothetical protein, partial [Lactobacillus delbrueckii]|uniref:hypothetical protein n=1 Tax=Lactobacillus delbrueckii TaxID=1584 RepID=UPI003A8B59A7